MSMKNVCMHTSHHPFLLGCCLLVCFCHLGHTVTRFLLSVLLVSGILLGFLSLPHYQLFLQNLSRAFPWVGDEGRALWASDAFPLPFFLSCLTGPVGHTLGPGFTDFTLEACSGEAPWHCKTHRIYLRLNMLPICTHTDPTDSGYTAWRGFLWSAVSQGSLPSLHSQYLSKILFL